MPKNVFGNTLFFGKARRFRHNACRKQLSAHAHFSAQLMPKTVFGTAHFLVKTHIFLQTACRKPPSATPTIFGKTHAEKPFRQHAIFGKTHAEKHSLQLCRKKLADKRCRKKPCLKTSLARSLSPALPSSPALPCLPAPGVCVVSPPFSALFFSFNSTTTLNPNPRNLYPRPRSRPRPRPRPRPSPPPLLLFQQHHNPKP